MESHPERAIVVAVKVRELRKLRADERCHNRIRPTALRGGERDPTPRARGMRKIVIAC